MFLFKEKINSTLDLKSFIVLEDHKVHSILLKTKSLPDHREKGQMRFGGTQVNSSLQ